MARDPDIEDVVKFYTDMLIEIYKSTDPALGTASEEFKLEQARFAINTWWKLYSKLMIWAQSQILGHSICHEEPEFLNWIEEKAEKALTVDSHDLEHIGMQFVTNRAPNQTKELEWYDYLLDAENDELGEIKYYSYKAMRTFISELLMSTSADSSFWRMELQHSLRALNEGEVDALSSPAPVKKQGQPYSLQSWKYRAILQVRYRMGKGMKKYRALQEVADGIGQSSETLRSWEKELKRLNFDYVFDFECAELAGFHEQEIDDRGPSEIYDYFDELGINRGIDPIEMARYLLRTIRDTSLEKIKENLRKYRQK